MLTDQYNNERLIVTTHTQALLQLKPIVNESPSELKRLQHTTTETINALRTLGHLVDKFIKFKFINLYCS